MKFEFSCTADETAMLVQDPVYQQLGSVLINQQKEHHEQCRDDLRRLHIQQKHNENLRRQVEVMRHTMQILEKRMAAYRKNHPDLLD